MGFFVGNTLPFERTPESSITVNSYWVLATHPGCDPVCNHSNLQTLVRCITLRRTKSSTVNGRPLVALPKKTVCVEQVELTPQERAEYELARLEGQSTVSRWCARVMSNGHQARVWLAITSCFKIVMWLPSSDITSGSVPPRCMMDRSSLPGWYSPLSRLVDWSSLHTSGWTLLLVMSLEGSDVTILKRLVMANHTQTWWENRGLLKVFHNIWVDSPTCDVTIGSSVGWCLNETSQHKMYMYICHEYMYT